MTDIISKSTSSMYLLLQCAVLIFVPSLQVSRIAALGKNVNEKEDIIRQIIRRSATLMYLLVQCAVLIFVPS